MNNDREQTKVEAETETKEQQEEERKKEKKKENRKKRYDGKDGNVKNGRPGHIAPADCTPPTVATH